MNPDYRPMPDEIRENLIRFARETWRNDGAEGETVHRLCDELEAVVADRDAWKRAAESWHRQWSEKCWQLTELRARAEQAEQKLAQAQPDMRPALAYISNGEAGDGQHVCACCGEERDEPHKWADCAKRLSGMHEKADGAYWDAVHERDEAIARAEKAESEARQAAEHALSTAERLIDSRPGAPTRSTVRCPECGYSGRHL